MLIIDCFMFWNEVEVLYMRLDTLYNVVDYFIICEAKISHSGKIKKDEYIFKKNESLYEKFMDKIIFIEYDECVSNGDSAINNPHHIWPNENKQRKWLFNKINLYPEDSLIAISDVDEIWDPTNIDLIKNNVEKYSVCGIIHKLTYYYINCFKTQKWKGTYFIKRKDLTFEKIQDLRNSRREQPSYIDGGWHFSWLGDVNSIKLKFQCIAEHDIIQNHCNDENIKDCVTGIKDLFGRSGYFGEIKTYNIDDNLHLYPKNIKKYIEKFPHICFTPL